ncbi:hypothetical protein [Microseira wollei]|nr:hypothetical protein [Microseira wollei]
MGDRDAIIPHPHLAIRPLEQTNSLTGETPIPQELLEKFISQQLASNLL